MTVALGLTMLVGLTLGVLGGGGSILMLPILVYIAGIAAQQAVPMSMVVVGGTSLLGTLLHAYRGNFHVKAAVLFSITGVVGSFLGSYLTHMVSQRVLMGIFAGLMLVVGLVMVFGPREAHQSQQCRVLRCLLMGAFVGVLTGFLGIGGGFMIVPALVLVAGIETKHAVGASLAIITLNAVAGVFGQVQQTSFDWLLTAGFLGLAIIGMLGGLVVAKKLPGETLRKAFGWFVVGMALIIGALSALGVSLP